MAEFGIHPYHRSEAPVADLVLVHGLMGDSRGTWTGKDNQGQPTYWPDWVKEQRPDVNIWLVDYESSLDGWLKPAMPLDQIAGSLLMHAHDQGLGTRPIHWVGHSMGGLIIKHLLCRARSRDNSNLKKFDEVPTAITFLGTPHHGSDVAEWKEFFGGLVIALDLFGASGAATALAKIFKRGAEKLRNQRIESHVQQLSKHSDALGKLNEDFAQWMASASKENRLIEARNYYEILPVKNAVVVVPKRSAQLANGLIEDTAAQENHLSICKYASRKNALFTGIEASLRALCPQSEKLPDGDSVANDLAKDGVVKDTYSRQQRTVPLDRKMLQHQAAHAIECLRRASAYWTSLQTSANLRKWLTAQCLISPSEFVESLARVPPGELPRLMRELRNVFKDQKNRPVENGVLISKEAEGAAAATVACFLFCTCLLIEAEAGDGVVGLPSVGDRHASHLLASLIALVMAGGRLELRPSDGALPAGSGTYRIQRTGLNPQFDFERQLYADLVKRPWAMSAGQKTGALSGDERNELLEELRNRRGDGVRINAMCFIVDGDEPSVSGVNVAREIGVPIFHASAEVTRVLFGVDAATLVTMLRHLWVDVCAYHSSGTEDSASS